MSGAFSSHLLNAHNSARPSTPNIITSGAMSFDARMHGMPGPSQTPFFAPLSVPHSHFGFAPLADDSATAKNIATLQAKLNKKLGPEYISQRPGPGGPKLTYAEGWKIINLANEVFGFNGWSSSIVNIGTDFVDYSEESRKFNVGVSAIVRVTLRDGVYHEDVGYGALENARSKAAALDKCKKEAVTDALKRTLRNFGNLLGNCLYDKSYAQEIVKIKVPPAKFDKNELYRRPEFEERVPDAPPLVTEVSGPPSIICQEHSMKVEPEGHLPETPITYVPRHLRQEMAAAAQQGQIHKTPHSNAPSGSGAGKSNASSKRPPVDASKSNGLATPIQTPMLSRTPLSRAPQSRQVATSPLARVRSAPERNVSFAEPEPAQAQISACARTVDPENQEIVIAGQANVHGVDEDDDPFPLSTQDGAFFATVDLGEGDAGRPIDFDEGLGGVDGSVLEEGSESFAQLPLSHHQLQLRVRTVCESSADPSSAGPSETSMRKEAHVQPVVKPSGCGQRQSRIGSSNVTASTSIKSASGPFAMPSAQDNKGAMTATVDGFHFPPSTKFTPKPVAVACTRMPANTLQSGSTTNSLKRNVEVMQTGSGSSRPPIQGMGLAQRQEQEQQQNASARRSLDNGEGTDLKRVKR